MITTAIFVLALAWLVMIMIIPVAEGFYAMRGNDVNTKIAHIALMIGINATQFFAAAVSHYIGW